jgi:hypothetical protein
MDKKEGATRGVGISVPRIFWRKVKKVVRFRQEQNKSAEIEKSNSKGLRVL